MISSLKSIQSIINRKGIIYTNHKCKYLQMYHYHVLSNKQKYTTRRKSISIITIINHYYQSITFLWFLSWYNWLRRINIRLRNFPTINPILVKGYRPTDSNAGYPVFCNGYPTKSNRTKDAITLLKLWEHPSHFPTFVVAFDRTDAHIMKDLSSVFFSLFKFQLSDIVPIINPIDNK